MLTKHPLVRSAITFVGLDIQFFQKVLSITIHQIWTFDDQGCYVYWLMGLSCRQSTHRIHLIF